VKVYFVTKTKLCIHSIYAAKQIKATKSGWV